MSQVSTINNNMAHSDSLILLMILGAVALFFILRGVSLWYWRIDTMVSNQEKQIELLTHIINGTKPPEKPGKNNPTATQKFSGLGSVTPKP
jgi:hypothetical protein